VARALAFEGVSVAWRGGPERERAMRLFSDSEALTNEVDQPHARGFLSTMRGSACYFWGEFKAGREHSERAEQILRERCTGVALEIGNAQLYSMMCMHYLGEVGLVRDKVRVAMKEAEARGDLYTQTNFRGRIVPYMLLAADDPAEARRELTEAMKRWPERVYVQHLVELLAHASIDLYTGDGPGAYRRVLDRWPAIKGAFLMRIQLIYLNMLYIRGRSALAAAVKGPDRAALLRSVTRDAQLIEKEAMAWATPWDSLLRAGVAKLSGQEDAAAEQLASAAVAFDALDMALHASASRLRRGQLLGGDEGRRLVSEAESWMAAKSIRNADRTAAIMIAGFAD
jgi:hypothetical protein